MSIGPAVVDTLNGAGSYSFIWIYVISPFAGGGVAAFVSAVQHEALGAKAVDAQAKMRTEVPQGA